ncbi:MAG: fasciclin domain-containing protein [Lysobacter sp.]|nr:MAG: fasciclin domain-containing protein [Lysobacter sp.]
MNTPNTPNTPQNTVSSNVAPKAGQAATPVVASAAQGKNLLDTAVAKGSFGTFAKAVEQAGLTDTLRGIGPFTVFAPTDAAFAKLPAGKLNTLMKPESKAELASILKYHVLAGRKSVADMSKWEAAKTVNGQSAPIKMTEGKFSIDGARITEGDIASSNGVIHGIDQVILPKTVNA